MLDYQTEFDDDSLSTPIYEVLYQSYTGDQAKQFLQEKKFYFNFNKKHIENLIFENGTFYMNIIFEKYNFFAI